MQIQKIKYFLLSVLEKDNYTFFSASLLHLVCALRSLLDHAELPGIFYLPLYGCPVVTKSVSCEQTLGFCRPSAVPNKVVRLPVPIEQVYLGGHGLRGGSEFWPEDVCV